MRTLFTIAWHEFWVTFRRPSFLIITALLPIAAFTAVLVLGVVRGREVAPRLVRAGYVDGTGIFASHLKQDNVEFVQYDKLEEGVEALLLKKVQRLYVIPSDYMTTGAVVRYSVGEGVDFGGGSTVDPPLRGFLLDNLLGSGLAPGVLSRAKAPLNLATVTLDPQGNPRQVDAGRITFFFIMAGLLITSIFMSSGFLLQGIAEEKENRIMEVLLSSVTPGQLMVGKILGLGAAGLGQILLWLASAWGVLQLLSTSFPAAIVTVPGPLMLVGVLFFLLGFLFFAALLAGLGAVASTARESQQISGLFVLPAIAPIYAWPYIISHPTSAVSRFLTLFPFTSPIVVFQRLGIGAIELWEVAASVLILALAVAAALFMVVRVFRAYLLMYGKRPGLRAVWQTLLRT